jgi:hypothetical protein
MARILLSSLTVKKRSVVLSVPARKDRRKRDGMISHAAPYRYRSDLWNQSAAAALALNSQKAHFSGSWSWDS